MIFSSFFFYYCPADWFWKLIDFKKIGYFERMLCITLSFILRSRSRLMLFFKRTIDEGPGASAEDVEGVEVDENIRFEVISLRRSS